MVFPTRARRVVRYGRSFRTGAGRPRRTEAVVYGREAWNSMEARPRARPVFGFQGDGLPEPVHARRHEDRRACLSRRHPGAAGGSMVSDLPEYGGWPQLAGHELPPRDRATHNP